MGTCEKELLSLQLRIRARRIRQNQGFQPFYGCTLFATVIIPSACLLTASPVFRILLGPSVPVPGETGPEQSSCNAGDESSDRLEYRLHLSLKFPIFFFWRISMYSTLLNHHPQWASLECRCSLLSAAYKPNGGRFGKPGEVRTGHPLRVDKREHQNYEG